MAHTPLRSAPVVPTGFVARQPTDRDLDDLVDLYNAVARQRNLAMVTEVDLLGHRTTDAWWTEALVLERESDGLVAAYAHFSEETDWTGDVALWVDGRVHPDATGHGLASFLLVEGERRAWLAAERTPWSRLALRTTNDNGNDRARALYERLGFAPIRHRLAMRIDLAGAARSGPRTWGLTIRPFDREADAHGLWRAMQEGFADHHDFAPTPFEDWRWILIDRHADFDPSLWFVAEADGRIVGGILCEVGVPEDPRMGHVRDLAIIPSWRRRGAADALLRQAFAAFVDRGLQRAGLDVDDDTLHGALRLYERAGMAVARRIDIYEKPLRGPDDDLPGLA